MECTHATTLISCTLTRFKMSLTFTSRIFADTAKRTQSSNSIVRCDKMVYAFCLTLKKISNRRYYLFHFVADKTQLVSFRIRVHLFACFSCRLTQITSKKTWDLTQQWWLRIVFIQKIRFNVIFGTRTTESLNKPTPAPRFDVNEISPQSSTNWNKFIRS